MPSATNDQRRTTNDQPTITAQHASATATGEATTTATAAPVFVVPEGWRLVWVRPGFTGAASVDLRAVGDVSLARHIEPVARSRPALSMLQEVAHLLRGDMVLGNLESPFTTRRGASLRPGPYRLPADPALADRLALFTALSLANNHALDAGPEGLQEARATLAEHGIAALGTAGTCAASPFVTNTTPRLHVLAFNAVRDPEDRVDEAEGCGRAWLDEEALRQIASIRRTTDDLVVVMVHWGDEYAPKQNEAQQEWARRLVGAGADLVLGAHPHVVQPMESLVED
jgi:poly-gamma-glutamate capsule biosynthesis protein CapA/YwtB (metallophosphatase superfamily)